MALHLLQSRIAPAQDSGELDEARKFRMVNLYRQSIGNLRTDSDNRDATHEYRGVLRSAPKEAAKDDPGGVQTDERA